MYVFFPIQSICQHNRIKKTAIRHESTEKFALPDNSKLQAPNSKRKRNHHRSNNDIFLNPIRSYKLLFFMFRFFSNLSDTYQISSFRIPFFAAQPNFRIMILFQSQNDIKIFLTKFEMIEQSPLMYSVYSSHKKFDVLNII